MILNEIQIKEILARNPKVLENKSTKQRINEYTYTGEEMLSLIQTFIKEKTGKDTREIQTPNGSLCPSFINLALTKQINPMLVMSKGSDIDAINCAFSVAQNYYYFKYATEKESL